MGLPRLLWDIGTAYDLFVSLEVLHNPADYGLRRTWAAGVRARLPAGARETLEQASSFVGVPFHWLYSLPRPKDGATVLWVLGRVPPADRLPILRLSPEVPQEAREVLQKVAARGAWDERDRENLQTYARIKGKAPKFPARALTGLLTAWSRAEEFGERYLQALRAYQQAFFAEEEERIRPALEAALARAQDMAGRLPLPDLLEELSQGLRFAQLPEEAELVLAPSFWCTPIVFFGHVSAERAMWLFGAKPADASLVPGEAVPDTLLRALKALSDPTRLRILRYLAEEPLTPAQLSRHLRLRIPTVTHHLRALRLAGLVHLTVGEHVEGEREPYTVRFRAVKAACASLESFLLKGEEEGIEAETNASATKSL